MMKVRSCELVVCRTTYTRRGQACVLCYLITIQSPRWLQIVFSHFLHQLQMSTKSRWAFRDVKLAFELLFLKEGNACDDDEVFFTLWKFFFPLWVSFYYLNSFSFETSAVIVQDVKSSKRVIVRTHVRPKYIRNLWSVLCLPFYDLELVFFEFFATKLLLQFL